MPKSSSLPRLQKQNYSGKAYVFWTHCIKNRKQGWLDDDFHHDFRELLIHTCAKYHLSCPIYCIMPDHWHFVLIGQNDEADQIKASSFFRKYIKDHLKSAELQKQAHDHVLRESERERDALSKTCHYIRQNPVRKNLVTDWQDYPYTGTIIAGYPDIQFGTNEFEKLFWKIHMKLSS